MGSCLSSRARPAGPPPHISDRRRRRFPQPPAPEDHDQEPVVKEVLSETPKPAAATAAPPVVPDLDLEKLKRAREALKIPAPLPPDDPPTSEISDTLSTSTTATADAESKPRPRRARSLSATDLPPKRQQWRPAGRSSPSPVRRRPPPPRRSVSPSLKRPPPAVRPAPPPPPPPAEENEDSLENPLVSLECFIFL